MRRIFSLMFFILMLLTSAASAETEVNKPFETTKEVYLPPMDDVPPITTQAPSAENADDSNSNQNSDTEQEPQPPQPNKPSIPDYPIPTDSNSNQKPDTEQEPQPPQPNKPSIPDYSIPDLPTEPSKPPVTDQPPTQPLEEGEGLEFRMVHRDGIMAFAVIADHEKYLLKPVLARDKIPGRATVKQMSNEYNAIAAINASYFGLSGELYGNTKIDGIMAGTTYYTRATLGINADKSTIWGRTDYKGKLTMGGATLDINGIDCERGADTVVIYNLHQGTRTGTNDFGVEFIVQNDIVTDIFRNKGNNEIPVTGYVISAHGKAAEILKNTQIGEKVIFEQSIVDVDGVANFDQAIQIVGAGPILVKNGAVYVTVDEEKFPSDIRDGRAPRSAVGVTKYGDYILAIVDGRQAHSKGCTLQEWAEILLNDFDAVNAINLDGGGSTELVVKGDIVNSPSDGQERPVGNALIIIKNP